MVMLLLELLAPNLTVQQDHWGQLGTPVSMIAGTSPASRLGRGWGAGLRKGTKAVKPYKNTRYHQHSNAVAYTWLPLLHRNAAKLCGMTQPMAVAAGAAGGLST